MKTFKRDELTVKIFENREAMGEAAAKDVAAKIKELLGEKSEINMIFAAAPSQNEVLAALSRDRSIEWGRINAFHMDEYIGLNKDAPQGFGNFLKTHIFSLVPLKSVHYIDITAKDSEKEAARYGELLKAHPADIVLMGIGENGHIAFNDPTVADFHDKKTVKAVALDEICRNQQVNDGCFKRLEDVPAHALTVTIPALTAAPWLFCVVPAASKANAVKETLTGRIDEHCPASILRARKNSALYLDEKSSALL